MITFPNAKINIGLNITKKRSDGFHNIETIFYPINLSDILEITISKNCFNYTNTGLAVESRNLESNLCYKAYQALSKDFKLPPINMHLHKIIPFGSGLGGGSSDASFTLKMLNHIFNLGLTNDDLINYSEEIGSDCAIFIDNKPAFAYDRGNKLDSIQINLSGKYLVLIHPGIHINTGLAYSNSKPAKPKESLKELIKLPIEKWKNNIINDFENIIFPNHPEIKKIKEKLYEHGGVYASMSGSGSSVYGIFNTKVNIKKLFPGCFIWEDYL